jgi:hypothetical protein
MSTVPRQSTGVYQRKLLYVPNLDPSIPKIPNQDDMDFATRKKEKVYPPQKEVPASPDKANAVTSNAFAVVADPELGAEVHLPCLDIDFKLSVDRTTLVLHGDFSEFAPDIVDAFKVAGVIGEDDDWCEDEEAKKLFISGWLSMPVIVPSSTEGHFHLYIDVPVPGDTYWGLLSELVAYGVIEEGYLTASKKTEGTVLRLVHDKKVDNSSWLPVDLAACPF